MKLPGYHNTTQHLHVNTQPTRAWYIPCATQEEALAAGSAPEASGRMLPLNGDWAFDYYESPFAVPEGAVNPSAADLAGKKTIPVPSAWQIHGYGRHQYTNVRYPFPFDPPYVPEENPCGLYSRFFTLPQGWQQDAVYINFEGVDSCFYLYVNGNFAGYSQVSHSVSEFDISAHVQPGENSVSVLVLQWCDGSYLEDQDKFRMSGIFRDVYLLGRPKAHLRDYIISTQLSGQGASLAFCAQYQGGDCETTLRLLAPDGGEVGTATAKGGEARLEIANPQLWNAEQPRLYTLLICTPGECILQKVGLREIAVEKGVILLNGAPLRLNGVNRHDSDPETGCAISRGQAMKDLALMKLHNVNAIRSSHYPNAPWFVRLCDELGFYLMDEADIESHGAGEIYTSSGESTFGLLAQNPDYKEAILDRVQRCVIRDKNSASVLFWSLGNESGYGPSMEEAGRWVKQYDPSRLLHYESSIHESGGHKNDVSMLDVYSRMYAPIEDIEAHFAADGTPKPFVQCEYSHAMGNGPGDLEDYFELMEKYPGFCGGFIWEWCDHAIYMGKTAGGRDKYFYGGDFGEYPHDGNFCMDGLVYPNRTPHTGLLEFKNVCRPVRAAAGNLEKGELTFTNMLRFTNAEDYLYAEYTVEQNGKPVQSGAVPLAIKPMESAGVTLGYSVPASGLCTLVLRYYLKQGSALAPTGHPLGQEQFVLRQDTVLQLPAPTGKAPTVQETETHIVLAGEGFRYCFSKQQGVFDSLVHGNVCYTGQAANFNLWRAPTDNDRNVREVWQRVGYNHMANRVYSVEAKAGKNQAEISCKLSLASPAVQPSMHITASWVCHANGQLSATIQCQRNADFPMLPRFGLRLFLPREMDRVEYFGYGPYESYTDKHQASLLSLYESTAPAMHENYLKPQENGSHCGCACVVLRDANGNGLAVTGAEPFSFNASPYTQEMLTEAQHSFEIRESGHTVLCLDYAQSGIGSNSCGPELLKKYRLDGESFTFRFDMLPIHE